MFVCCDVFTPAKTFIFFTALCPLRFSHKSCGYKEMRCSDFKATRRKRKEYFASWEHLLGQFQSWSGNTTSQIFAAHEHRKCITSRHCRVERTQPAHNLTCCVIHNTNLWGRDDSEDTIIDRDVLFFFPGQNRTESTQKQSTVNGKKGGRVRRMILQIIKCTVCSFWRDLDRKRWRVK